TDQQVDALFVSSVEYIHNHGGAGAAWVTGLYRDLLGRTPGADEVQGWLSGLGSGTPASAVALGIAASPERAAQRVLADYQTYLGRTAGQDEVDGWVKALEGGMTNEDMAAAFLSSGEYYQDPEKGRNNETYWVNAAYLDLLFRAPAADEIHLWL